MNELSKLIDSAVEIVAKYRRATIKPYQNIEHVLIQEGEVLVPSDTEKYVFRLKEGWKIVHQNKEIIIIKRS